MNENRVVHLRRKDKIDDPLTEILRFAATRLIARAAEFEFDTFLSLNADLWLAEIRERVVCHGHVPVRTIQSGIGPVEAQNPKARERGAAESGERVHFTSATLPKWARRTKCLAALLPVPYLREISAAMAKALSFYATQWRDSMDGLQKESAVLPRFHTAI
jgi:putative transposase